MTSKVSTGLGPIPQFPPVAPLSSQAAQAFIHIHPFLLLSLFYIRFNALVADPVQTQLISLIPLAIIQISYVITCLPPAGSIIAGKVASPDKTRKTTPSGARRKAHSKNGSLATKVMSAMIALTLSFILASPVLFIILVLFGAPLTTHFPHTFLLATHIALIAVLPLFYVHGVNGQKWRAVGGMALPMDEVFGGTFGALMGAWLGAVPIPLDWDREWQKWPVTILTGVYLGYVIGKFAGEYVFYGKVIPMEPEEVQDVK